MWGELWEGVRTQNKFQAVYYLVFTLRRVIYCFISFILTDYTIFQAQSLIACNAIALIYAGQFQPRISRFANRIELFNEFIVGMVTIHMLYFTNYTPKPEFQYTAGYSMIFFISLIILVNLVIIFLKTGHAMKLLYMRYKEHLLVTLGLKHIKLTFPKSIRSKNKIKKEHMALKAHKRRPTNILEKYADFQLEKSLSKISEEG